MDRLPLARLKDELTSVPAKAIVAIILAIIAALFTTPVINFIKLVSKPVVEAAKATTSQFLQSPQLHLFMVLVFGILFYLYFKEKKKLNLLAGTFTDNFKHGLLKWDYDGEHWTTHESKTEGRYLEVTHSGQGGITRRTFKLDNYVFSFEAKLMNAASGWIPKAEDRSRYVMVQCQLRGNEVFIRPHLYIDELWVVLAEERIKVEEIEKKILQKEWFAVKIEVKSNDIYVYIDSIFIYHFEIPSPIRIPEQWNPVQEVQEPVSTEGDVVTEAKEDFAKRQKELNITLSKVKAVSFVSGRVGFRCHGAEKSWFRKVKVKPVFND